MANRKKIDNEYFGYLLSHGSVVPRCKSTGRTLDFRVGAIYQIENAQTKEIASVWCTQNMPCNLVLINKTDLTDFNIDKAEVRFHKELESKLFNSFTFEYHEECGGCWLVSDEIKISLNSFYGEDDDNPEEFGFLISICNGDYEEIDMAKREWVDYPEPTNNEEFEAYKLFYLELLEKYSSKDLVD